MKIALFISLYALWFFSDLAQQKTDKDLNNLRGTVHTVSTTVTLEMKEAGKAVKRDTEIDNLEVYDRQGNLVEKKGKAGLNLSQSVFSRDAQGRRIEKMVDVPRNPLAPPLPAVPGGGERNADFLTFITVYQFDAEKNRLEATTHRRSGQLLWIDTYIFDEKGLLIEHARKDRADAEYGSGSRFVYKRDERGIQLESASYTVDGRLEEKTEYKDIAVDSRGNWIKRTETTQSAKGTPYPILTSVRQITYY